MARKTAPPPERFVIPCAHDGCTQPAMTRRDNANLCFMHADLRHRQDTRAYLKGEGLDRQGDETREAWLYRMQQWRRKRMANFGQPKSKEWCDKTARRVVADYEAGKPIGQFSYDAHLAYLRHRTDETSTREPGEDEAAA